MSELIQENDSRATIRWKLLTGASALALAAYISSTNVSKAEDADRPTIWIELGGQLERQSGQGDPYDPPFVVNYASSDAFNPISPLHVEKPPLFSIGEEAKITFQPEGSDWVFSAGIRYGRASNKRSVSQIGKSDIVHYGFPEYYYPTGFLYTPSGAIAFHTGTEMPGVRRFADTDVAHKDTHAVLDFQAGKDVGLGLFGQNSESVVSLGVRFAQFTANSSAAIHAKPDTVHYNGVTASRLRDYPKFYEPYTNFHLFAGTARSQRSFHGVGPEISWSASVALAGNADAGMLSFDWGVNAAMLFGRRKAKGQHHESGHYHRAYYNSNTGTYSHTAPFNRSQNVTVPNVGGFAGVSYKFVNAKVSIGYQADLFMNAMDVGWDAVKKSNALFNGPYASISVGIGD